MHVADRLISAHAVEPPGRPVVTSHVAPYPRVAARAQPRLDAVEELDGATLAPVLLGEEEVEAVDVAVRQADAEAVEVWMVAIGPPVVAGDLAVEPGDEAAVATLEAGGEPAGRPRVAAAAIELGQCGKVARAEIGEPEALLERDVRDLVEALEEDDQLMAPEAAPHLPRGLNEPVTAGEATDVRSERAEPHEPPP